jgi:hypothetical protein
MTMAHLSGDDATALVTGPFGQELAKVPGLYAAPICTRAKDGEIENGTTFFVDCGFGAFGVTAGHVYDELKLNLEQGASCYIGECREPFDLHGRLISRGSAVDVATYLVTPNEISAAGVHVLTHRGEWPPSPPELNQAIRFGGFPGHAREVGFKEALFNGITGAGIANSINDRDVSCLLEREDMIPLPGLKFPAEGYDFAGMSGAPALTIATTGVISWRLAGVVYECGSKLMEIIKIARADLIAADGTILG